MRSDYGRSSKGMEYEFHRLHNKTWRMIQQCKEIIEKIKARHNEKETIIWINYIKQQ